jgi:hypothetical protein
MNKIVFISALLILSLNVAPQDFSFKMTFIDAVGNTDTIVVGYDTDATDSVDVGFGELNIIDIPWDSLFDVRISNEYKIKAWIGYEHKTKYH